MENQLRIISAEIEESNKNWRKYKVKSKPAPSKTATLSAPARDPRLMSQSNQLEQAVAIPEEKQVPSASKSAIDRSEEIKERVALMHLILGSSHSSSSFVNLFPSKRDTWVGLIVSSVPELR